MDTKIRNAWVTRTRFSDFHRELLLHRDAAIAWIRDYHLKRHGYPRSGEAADGSNEGIAAMLSPVPEIG